MDKFPPDIHYRYIGDEAEAEKYIGLAKNLFSRAQLMQAGQPDKGQPVQLVRYLDGGGSVTVTFIGDMKTITIVPPPAYLKKDIVEKEDISSEGLYVLCGIIRKGNDIVDAGVTKLRDYKPTLSTSLAHKVPNAYHDNKRLATTGNAPRAGYFSGAMKRVVAAIEGLGKIRDSSPQYLTPEPDTRIVTMKYSFGYAETDGIYKAGVKNHWLVRISSTQGVLAMPLPLIESTKTPSYLKYLQGKKDTGGLAIVNEFGGLPSGETFPTGADLNTAITNGRVLRLKTASDMEAFYRPYPGAANSYVYGWAFSDSGRRVSNVRFVYQKVPPAAKYSISGELWDMSLNLSMHNTSVVVPNPVGTGSVTFGRTHTGKLSKHACSTMWANSQSESLECFLRNYATADIEDLRYQDHPTSPPSQVVYRRDFSNEGWGCFVHVYYDGEAKKGVKWIPHFYNEQWATQTATRIYQPPNIDNNLEHYIMSSDGGYRFTYPGYTSPDIDIRPMEVFQSLPDIPDGTVYVPDTYTRYQANGIYSSSGIDNTGPYDYVLPWEQAYPYSFIATPTNMPFIQANVASAGYALYTLLYYYAENQTASLDDFNSSAVHFGSGASVSDVSTTVNHWMILPGGCREGVVMVTTERDYNIKTYAVLANRKKAKGHFTGVGVIEIPVDNAVSSPPDMRYYMYFGIQVNPGPTRAYVMTSKIVNQSEPYGGPPSKSPGWTHVNVLPDTGNVKVDDVKFIGSY